MTATNEFAVSPNAIIGDIEQIRTTEGNSVTIVCDNPEADTLDRQAAVDVCGDFTGWQETRYWGTTKLTGRKANHEQPNDSRNYARR